MSVLSKEQWEARARAVARRNARNALIETLTPEQHDLIAELCAYRHDLHCGSGHMWCSGSGDHSRLWKGLAEWDFRLAEAGLPRIGLDGETYITDSVWDLDYGSEGEAREALERFVEGQNRLIERWLHAVDEEHGTHYEPTGAHRALI